MTTNTIDEMLAELPPKGDDWLTLCVRLNFELAVLKAAAEKRQETGHALFCRFTKDICTCGFDEMRKVLEALRA